MNVFKLTVRAAGSAFCLLVLNACATPSQAYWDAKVKELCEKEGGVKVYEKVTLTQEEYKAMNGRNGIVLVPIERPSKKSNFPYYLVQEVTYVNKNPDVKKLRLRYFRRNDNMVIGEYVDISRISDEKKGSFSCHDVSGVKMPMAEKEIFVIRGEL